MTSRAAALAVSILLAACERRASTEDLGRTASATPSASVPAGPASDPEKGLDTIVWDFPDGPFGRTVVVTLIPTGATGERYPVLVAFHGRGESLKSPERGARGWLEDYRLGHAIERLSNPPLTQSDFHGFVTRSRLSQHNDRLARRPFHGLIVVCPYLADVLRGPRAFDEAPALAAFVVDRLLPRVLNETPAMRAPAVVGIDGVSLGGRAALLVGLTRPRAFRSVGALQPAIDVSELPRLTELAAKARQKNPDLFLRLLTSDDDYFLRETTQLAGTWKAARVEARLDRVVGPHDYVFNQGPGAFEMLLHHDAVLRGSTADSAGAGAGSAVE